MDARIATSRIDGLDAVTIRDRIAGGALRAVEVAEAYLAVTAQKEPGIGAFAHLDREHVLAQAALVKMALEALIEEAERAADRLTKTLTAAEQFH